MKKHYRKIALLLLVVMVLLTAVGCAPQAPSTTQEPGQAAEKTNIRIGTLKGPTGMGMVKLMEDAQGDKTKNKYQFDIIGAPEDMVGKVTTGEVDIAAVPVNLAAILYQKTANFQIAAINTLGVLYIVDRSGSIDTIADLKGKTIYATGKGSSPEFVLNYILSSNGLDPAKDLTIEYKGEHTELATLLLGEKVDIALLPEPFVTTVLAKGSNIQRKIDLTQEWEKSTGKETPLTMGCIIVNAAFAKEHKEAVDTFLSEYAASVDFVNQNIQEAGELIAQYGIMDNAKLAEQAIPSCNIVYLDGDNMKKGAEKFLEVLFEAEPKSIGGQMPDDEFYYQK